MNGHIHALPLADKYEIAETRLQYKGERSFISSKTEVNRTRVNRVITLRVYFTKYETITSVTHHSDQLQLLPPVASSAPGCGCTNLLKIWGKQQNPKPILLSSCLWHSSFFPNWRCRQVREFKMVWQDQTNQRLEITVWTKCTLSILEGGWAQSMSTKFTSTADGEIDDAPSPWSRCYSSRQIDAGLSNITEDQLYPYWSYCFTRQEEIAYIKT